MNEWLLMDLALFLDRFLRDENRWKRPSRLNPLRTLISRLIMRPEKARENSEVDKVSEVREKFGALIHIRKT